MTAVQKLLMCTFRFKNMTRSGIDPTINQIKIPVYVLFLDSLFCFLCLILISLSLVLTVHQFMFKIILFAIVSLFVLLLIYLHPGLPYTEGEDRGKGDREKGDERKEKGGGRKERNGGRKEIKGENEETKRTRFFFLSKTDLK